MPLSTSPRSSTAEWILAIALLGQTLGGAIKALRRSTSLNTTLFLNADWDESLAQAVDEGTALLALAAAVSMLWRPTRLAAAIIGVHVALIAASSWVQGASYFEGLTIPAYGMRMGTPWVFLLILAARPKAAEVLARIACAATFAAHGIEAWKGQPNFVDLLLTFGHNLFGVWWPQSTLLGVLKVIGAVDLACAAAILFVPSKLTLARGLALYMGFWGGITAISRIVQFGLPGVDLTLWRSTHAGLAIALFFIWRAGVQNRANSGNDMDPKRSESPA